MKQLKADFVEMLATLRRLPRGGMMDNLADTIAQANPSVTVRVNRRKDVAVPSGRRQPPWAEAAVYIDGERPRFTFDPALHQGLYYVQDASSMAIADIVKRLTADSRAIVYADLCAAPGGKTTAVADVLPQGSLIMANEFDGRRAEALRENIIKWGYPSVIVSRGDTARYRRLGAVADIVAVDAPCSGEGMMRKDDDAINQWSPALVNQCAALQREILANAWELLRPGGYLIYSTCTFNLSEDEHNVAWLCRELGAEMLPTGLNDYLGVDPSLDETVEASRFIPGRVDGEGLFIALLRKPAADSAAEPQTRSKKAKSIDKPIKNAPKWLNPELSAFTLGSDLYAIDPAHRRLLDQALKALDVIYAGTQVASIKGADYIPAHPLALSQTLDQSQFAHADVDYSQAIAYLRGESIALEGAPRAFVLLRYQGRPLGFVKNLGNRANNLYPKAWAIKSTYIPDSPISVI
jgi:16S rRNA C967 or C1407 C5-methylase (RsmB/RsmF family)/NOL1/NOP2/fmu family ribosome biogenesis protein